MQEGDIYLVEIPSSSGREQAGLRPAIVVQAVDSKKLPTVLIVPLTSKLKAADFPFTFIVEPNQFNNLNIASVALVFQLRAIDKRRLKNKIGKIEQAKLELLRQNLKEIMGLAERAGQKE
ncbi:MAG TPA: type II toxin-antitoxin system PemK/MazF family toxin [Candidatus Brocadiales bacterium]|nr:type II toxin-antitoxin system PemK/MazF family toxin [Candidatus Brocadiales bacterium]